MAYLSINGREGLSDKLHRINAFESSYGVFFYIQIIAMIDKWFWIIPNSVLFNDKLSDKQKLLFCLISSLCAEHWYCRASNKYIWDKLFVCEETISRNISNLIKLWFLTSEILENNSRKLYLVVWQKYQGGMTKTSMGVWQKRQHNNIIDNNIKENNSNNNKVCPFLEIIWPLKKALEDFEDHRKSIKAPMSIKSKEILLKTLKPYSLDIKIKMLEVAILNWWRGVFPLKEQYKTPPWHIEWQQFKRNERYSGWGDMKKLLSM
jgi:hypothetical protein